METICRITLKLLTTGM